MRGVVALAVVLLLAAPGVASAARTKPARLAAETAGRTPASLILARHTLIALDGDRRAERLLAARGGVEISPALRLWRVAARAALEVIPELRRLGGLRYAEPDLPVRPVSHLPGDPLGAPELGYHLYRIGADRADPPGPGFPLTIVDTGLDLAHPEFAARPNTQALNPQQASDPASAVDYHGTLVASVAAAPLDGIGAVGVYPQAVLRMFDAGELSNATVVAGIEAAVAAGPSVINLSLGSPQRSQAVEEAALRAFGSGSLIVAASGNDFDRGNPINYPAGFPHVLTVAATDRNDQPSLFSSASFAVDLAAPGEDIPSLDPRDIQAYFTDSGTSLASPMVAAAVAWLRTSRPTLEVTQVFEIMRQSARDVATQGFDERTGFGLLDIPAALSEPAPARDPQEPNDDVAHIVANGLFPQAKPPIRGRFAARLDATEDPDDLYRIVLPARRTTVVTVTADDDVAVALLSSRIRSLGQGTGRNRLRSSNRPGRQAERITYENRTRAPVAAFLHVTGTPAAQTGNPSYTVAITTRANARRSPPSTRRVRRGGTPGSPTSPLLLGSRRSAAAWPAAE